jgi:hypothetical protein
MRVVSCWSKFGKKENLLLSKTVMINDRETGGFVRLPKAEKAISSG